MVYDRNGNFTDLERYGGTGLENDLTYTRSGNRMTVVVCFRLIGKLLHRFLNPREGYLYRSD